MIADNTVFVSAWNLNWTKFYNLRYVQRGVRHATQLGEAADKLVTQCDTLLEKLDDMWSITECELYERGYRKSRQENLAKTVLLDV